MTGSVPGFVRWRGNPEFEPEVEKSYQFEILETRKHKQSC